MSLIHGKRVIVIVVAFKLSILPTRKKLRLAVRLPEYLVSTELWRRDLYIARHPLSYKIVLNGVSAEDEVGWHAEIRDGYVRQVRVLWQGRTGQCRPDRESLVVRLSVLALENCLHQALVGASEGALEKRNYFLDRFLRVDWCVVLFQKLRAPVISKEFCLLSYGVGSPFFCVNKRGGIRSSD